MDVDRIPPLTDLAGHPPELGNEPPGWDEHQARTADLAAWPTISSEIR